MKFLCDRCTTRYSIGDERVRGKILKIRCKHCGNVITVREGMAIEPDAASPDGASRSGKATTGPQAVLDDRSAPDVGRAPVSPGEPAAASGRATGRDPLAAASRGAAKDPRSMKVAAVAAGSQGGGAPGLAVAVKDPAGAAQVQSSAPAAADGEPDLAMEPIARAQRRGRIALLTVAGVVVLGATGTVIAFATADGDATGGSLGAVHDIDISRPEEPIARSPLESAGTNPAPAPPAPAALAPPAPAPAPGPPGPRRPAPHLRANPGGRTGGRVAEAPIGGGLSGDEIEDVARKHQGTTQRCYLRSRRGADAILIGDVRMIAVTLTVDRAGNVSDLKLSEHAEGNLGRCLSTAIRRWKFRPSSGGTYRFSLSFAGG